MGSSEFGWEVAEINEKSTIPELIGLLLSSYKKKDFKVVEKILINREEELKTQLKKEQEERRLLEKRHGMLELESLEMADDLKRLKNENLELQEELEKLKGEKLETAQKFRGYEERMTNLEKAVANGLSICDSLENNLQKEGNSNFDCKQTMENASNHHEYAQASFGGQSPSNGPWFGTNSSHQEKKSCDNRTLELRKNLLNGHGNAQIGIEDAHDTPKVGIDGLKQENENDSSCAAASKSIKRTCDGGPQSPIDVEITESDDEASEDEKPYVSTTCFSEENSSKKGITFMQSARGGCPTQDKDKGNVRSNAFENLLRKRKRSLTETDYVGISRKLDFLSTDDSSDYSSSDSDEDCSESVINKMIENLREDWTKSQKIWNLATDMRSEFLTNNELCMHAVCALYRKEISAGKSINYKSSPINLGLNLFGPTRNKDLADFLIDGDPQYKLKRTVSEVQQKDSTLLDRCKDLAIKYYEILFEIYCENEDPFFPARP